MPELSENHAASIVRVEGILSRLMVEEFGIATFPKVIISCSQKDR
jgi:hypothetical protein